jgi:drug/metabolite transporter (DMT)-like permease
MIMDRTQREGVMFVLLTALGYSFTPIFSKIILANGMPPVDIAVWRFLFAAPLIWVVLVLRRVDSKSERLPRFRLLAIGGFFLVTAALCVFIALQYITAGTFEVLFYTYPAIVALLSLFRGERLPPLGWLALALTLVGIVLTVPDFGLGLQGGSLLGVLLSLLNAVVVAFYFFASSRTLRGYTALAHSSAWIITGSALVLGVIGVFRGVALPLNATVWLSLLGMALVSTVLPVFCLTVGLQKLSAARAAITGTVEPFLTLIWAALLLGERMELVQFLGGLLILVSVILLQLARNAATPSTPAAVGSPAAGD